MDGNACDVGTNMGCARRCVKHEFDHLKNKNNGLSPWIDISVGGRVLQVSSRPRQQMPEHHKINNKLIMINFELYIFVSTSFCGRFNLIGRIFPSLLNG